MRRRDLAWILGLLPLLAAFGPGNCGGEEDFGTRSIVSDDRAGRDVDDDDYDITIPRGVAVVLQCRGTCNEIDVIESMDPERLFAGATHHRAQAVGEVAILVGLAPGDVELHMDVYDLSYTFHVHVTEPEADASRARRFGWSRFRRLLGR